LSDKTEAIFLIIKRKISSVIKTEKVHFETKSRGFSCFRPESSKVNMTDFGGRRRDLNPASRLHRLLPPFQRLYATRLREVLGFSTLRRPFFF